MEENATKRTAISWFCKNKAFQHIVHALFYAQALKKGSNPVSREPLKRFSVAATASVPKANNVLSVPSHRRNDQFSSGKGSVTKCGSVAGGTVRTNTETDQSISTSNRFQPLMEFSQEDNSTSSLDYSLSYSGISQCSTDIVIRTTISNNKESKGASKTIRQTETCVQSPECQPCFTS